MYQTIKKLKRTCIDYKMHAHIMYDVQYVCVDNVQYVFILDEILSPPPPPPESLTVWNEIKLLNIGLLLVGIFLKMVLVLPHSRRTTLDRLDCAVTASIPLRSFPLRALSPASI